MNNFQLPDSRLGGNEGLASSSGGVALVPTHKVQAHLKVQEGTRGYLESIPRYLASTLGYLPNVEFVQPTYCLGGGREKRIRTEKRKERIQNECQLYKQGNKEQVPGAINGPTSCTNQMIK